MSDALNKLIEAVEAGAATMNDFASVFPSESAYGKTTWGTAHNAFSGSVDAAKELHEALLPGWFLGMSKNLHSGLWYAWVQDKESVQFCANEPTPARAWLLAVLRAYAAQQEPTP